MDQLDDHYRVTIRVKRLPEGVFLATSDDVPGLQVECGNTRRDSRHRAEIAFELL